MPRARNIKPGFFENEFLGTLPGDIQLLFIGLWTLADREGVIEYRPAKIRKALFGFRSDITDEIFNQYLSVLENLDNGSMLSFPVCNENKYIVITNFLDHQRPHHTEKKGKLPALKTLMEAKRPPLTVRQPLSNGENPCQNALIPDLLIPDLLIPESVIEEKSREHKFEEFWEKYPKHKRSKGSKKDAERKFYIALKKSSFAEIMMGLKNYSEYIRRLDQSNQDAFRWLNNERWKEDYDCSKNSLTLEDAYEKYKDLLGDEA